MSKKLKKSQNRLWAYLRTSRRLSQVLFLALFFFLVFASVALTGDGFDAKNSATVPLPVEAFLNIDPFNALIIFLTTFSIPQTLLWSLIIVFITIFTGRGFCGWICPMGSINHAVSEYKPSLTAAKKIKINSPKPAAKIKYLLFLSLVTSAFFGSAAAGIFDPISMLTRGVSLTVLPVINFFGEMFTNTALKTGSPAIKKSANIVYNFADGILFHHSGLIATSGIMISLFFIAILVSNRFIPRFWCRYLCPLGALLGLLSRFSLLELKKDSAKCINCKKCEQFCSLAASPIPGTKWERAECDLCMNCVAVCEHNALSFGLAGTTKKDKTKDSPDLSRRNIISSTAAGAMIVPVLRTGSLSVLSGRPDPACIRPPGAVDEEEFLKRCIRCGQCMKICPNNALHPALDEAGPEGLWTPVLVPKVGYCEPTCTLCSQVCPTAAIKRVTEDQKTGSNGKELIRLGTAFIDRGRCLPWSMDTPCTVCEEFCPVSPKAIRLKEVSVTFTDSKEKTVLQPFVNPDLCTGCGACENACPVHDKAAITVSSAGESRSTKNRLLL